MATDDIKVGGRTSEVAINLSTENPLQKIKNSLDKYIVRPFNQFGFGGFVFDIEEDASITLSNDITDHFTEDNTTIQDQIAIKPKRVVLKNFIGELTDIVQGEFQAQAQRVIQKLTILSALLPAITASTEQSMDAIDGAKRTENFGIDSIADASGGFLNLFALTKNLLPPVTKQEQTYLYLKALRDQKILVGLQTPFEFMPNMAIETIVAKQDGTTRFVSDFTITLKEIRFAQVQTRALTQSEKRGLQSKKPVNQNKIAGTDVVDESAACKILRSTGNVCEVRRASN
jgi:hypothetical protein